MAVTENDRATDPIAGECESGGPKRLKTDDDGLVYVITDASVEGIIMEVG